MVSTGLTEAGALWLDEERHKAFLGEREIIRATSAFTELGLINTDWFTPESRERGLMIHDAVPKWHEGYAVQFLPHVKPYWDGFLLFMQECDFLIHRVEQPVYDDTPGFEYAGRYDLFGKLPAPMWVDGYNDLIDIKTGSCPPTTKWQTIGYGRRIPVPAMRLRRWALVLPGNGRYGLVPLNLTPDGKRVDILVNRQHEQDFLSIIRAANLRRELRHAR